jgi:hypothetical protein
VGIKENKGQRGEKNNFVRIFVVNISCLKSFFIIFLASLFLLQSAGKLIVIANFELNRDYIAKQLCENKAKPKLHCNGKCYLKKQLQKEDKKENSNTASSKEKLEVQFFSKINFLFQKHNFTTPPKLTAIYLFTNYSKHTPSIFHPPQA